MAPPLSPAKKQLICDMIKNGKSISDTAFAAECSKQAVKYIRSNLRLFGTPGAPPNHVGRWPNIIPPMLEALRDHLLVKPGLYLDEMADFLWDVFEVNVSTDSISRALKKIKWSKKTIQQKAKEQNPEWRDEYRHDILEYHSYQLVYVDESGCDKRSGIRRTGWSPPGITPVERSKFHRGQRYQILPAYSQDGIVISHIYKGSTDAALFENLIEQLLHHCGRYPGPRSVLIMDNASFHRSERVEQMCIEKGVRLIYLPPYSPDLNPIEEFFAELKAFIRRKWTVYKEDPEQDFGVFLERCVDTVGARKRSARGHFRHAGVAIYED